MATAQPPCPEPEFTMICIDNGTRALYNKEVYKAQLDGARRYCETVFECDPGNLVGILLMNSKSEDSGVLVCPTSDLKEIRRALKYVPFPRDGTSEFELALGFACSYLSRSPADMKRRLLMFVGCTIHLDLRQASSCGEQLKASGVALDIFNFRKLSEAALKDREALKDPQADVLKGYTIFEGRHHYAREELGILVDKANADGNSRITDIADGYVSSVDKILDSILEKHTDYLKKKATADDEKNKSVEASGGSTM